MVEEHQIIQPRRIKVYSRSINQTSNLAVRLERRFIKAAFFKSQGIFRIFEFEEDGIAYGPPKIV
jgi:hypothetical protein